MTGLIWGLGTGIVILLCIGVHLIMEISDRAEIEHLPAPPMSSREDVLAALRAARELRDDELPALAEGLFIETRKPEPTPTMERLSRTWWNPGNTKCNQCDCSAIARVYGNGNGPPPIYCQLHLQAHLSAGWVNFYQDDTGTYRARGKDDHG